MKTEWSKWLDFQVVVLIPPDQVKKHLKENDVKDSQIVGTSWGHTDKNDGKFPVTGKALDIDARSLLVVQGHQEINDHTSMHLQDHCLVSTLSRAQRRFGDNEVASSQSRCD